MRKNRKRQVARQKESTIQQSLLDIIIPTYNNFAMLENCLNSIPKAIGDWNCTVIVVDNASDKEKANEFYSHYKIDDERISLRIIRNRENYGYPKGCNIGARRGLSPLIFLTNDDVVFDENSLDLVVKALDDQRVGVAGMKYLFPETHKTKSGKRAVQHVGIMSIFTGDVIHCYLGWSEDHPKVNAVRDVLAISGCCLMTRRKLWNMLGGYDEGYGMGYYEDVDYCLRVREMGLRVIVEPRATGTHYVGSSFGKLGNSPMMLNRLRFAQKWAGKMEWTEWLYW